MNISFDINTFNINNVYFTEKKKNNIIQGIFTKILYSTEEYTMTGIYIRLPISLKLVDCDKQHVQINYSNLQSGKLFHSICSIEEQLLDQYKNRCQYKTPILSLKTQLMYGTIKIYKETCGGGECTYPPTPTETTCVETGNSAYADISGNLFIDKKIDKKIYVHPSPILQNVLNEHVVSGSDVAGSVTSGFHKQQSLLLKIAGIWENDTNFGITFKFLRE